MVICLHISGVLTVIIPHKENIGIMASTGAIRTANPMRQSMTIIQVKLQQGVGG